MDQRDNPLNAMSPAERAERSLDDASNSESPLDRINDYAPGSILEHAVSQAVKPGHMIPALANACMIEDAFRKVYGDLYDKAIGNGLWFHREGMWLSPRQFHAKFYAMGDSVGGPGLWQLRDPHERVKAARDKLIQDGDRIERMLEEIQAEGREIEAERQALSEKPAGTRQYVNTEKLSAHLSNLIDAVANHRDVVKDTHPGLMTWREMYYETWQMVEDAIALVRAENGMEAPKS